MRLAIKEKKVTEEVLQRNIINVSSKSLSERNLAAKLLLAMSGHRYVVR